MTDAPKPEGSKYPTLMLNFETDEDLDDYVIDNAYMFVVIQIRPGGFVNGYGSNYTRTEVHVKEGQSQREALEEAMQVGFKIYEETKKSLLVYAVANFAGALGFNRPVRSIPVKSYRSKADQRRDERRAIAARKVERARAKEAAGTTKTPKTPKPKLKAAVFNTDFEEPKQTGLVDEEFYATDVPLARLVRD